MTATVVLYRPIGAAELALLVRNGFREFPARLPGEQMHFPVTDHEYAAELARQWNTTDAASGYVGYVTRFEVRKEFLDGFPLRQAGSPEQREYWIPADKMSELNRNIVGPIEVIAEFRPAGDAE